MGRILSRMEFQTELRGNGKQNSGLSADAPIISRLFRACGFAMTALATKSMFGVFDVGAHANAVAWATSAASATNTDVIAYYVEVTTGGASGVAQITITSDTAGEGSAAAAITSGAAVTLGTKGATITPTFTGALAVGQRWVVWLLPLGIKLLPISDNFESVTLGMYKDGVKHLMPGSFGTFDIEATAGDYARVNWNFSGTYQAPIDAANPTPTYERTLPAQVELARLRVDRFNAIVERFTYAQNNDIQIRPDVSSSQGYIGTRLVGRNPEGGIDPEADLVANYDFWSALRNASRNPFQMRIGSVAGNTVWLLAPGTQYTGLTYADRNGIQTYDAGLKFAGYNGDDEFCIFLA